MFVQWDCDKSVTRYRSRMGKYIREFCCWSSTGRCWSYPQGACEILSVYC